MDVSRGFRIEESVGTLVWVRRRNGSWWPGRILGPDELPVSHLMPPKSGTPVKLLGREDASVDWYNIGKSKRVKAFRCGEFDECIEKAQSISGLPTKKREKYARREDAIVHALELEKKQIEKKDRQGLLLARAESGDHRKPVVNTVLDDYANTSAQESDDGSDCMGPKTLLDAAPSAVSIQKASLENITFSPVSQRKKISNHLDWDDPTTEATPRMRGLQDFGLKIASSKKRKTIANSACEGVSKVPLIRHEDKTISCISRRIGVGGISNMLKGSCGMKRKRSQMGSSTDDSACKRRDRRRPLTKVLKNSAKLTEICSPGLDSSRKWFSSPGQTKGKGLHIAQPSQEVKMSLSVEPFNVSDGFEYLSSRQYFEVQHSLQDVYEHKQGTFNMGTATEKSCSSFSDHLNGNCCDEEPLAVAPLTGSAFVDSLLTGTSPSTSSFLSGSAYAGPATSGDDTGLDKPSCISMTSMEDLTHPSSFRQWAKNSIREASCDKLVSGLGMAQFVDIVPCTSGFLSQPMKMIHPSDAMPVDPSHTKVYEDYRSDLESSFTFLQSDLDGDLGKRHKFLIQGYPAAKPTAIERLQILVDDEAESLQTRPGLLPPSEGLIDLKHVEPVDLGHTLISPTNEGQNDREFFDSLIREDPSGQVPLVATESTISRWQAKGRRNARVLRKRPFKSTYGMAFADLEEIPNVPINEEKLGWEEECMLQYVIQQKYGLDKEEAFLKGKSEMHPGYQSFQETSTQGLFHDKVIVDVPRDIFYGRPSFKSENGHEASFSSIMQLQGSIGNNVDAHEAASKRVTESLWLQNNSNCEQTRYFQSKVAQLQESSWVDVEVEMKASCQGEHVPLVSLMSKLNSKAIVGHPVVVERLGSKYRESYTGVGNDLANLDVQMETLSRNKSRKVFLHPVWRTARRTAMQRVPRSCAIMVGREWRDLAQPMVKQTRKLGYLGLLNHRNRLIRNKIAPSMRKNIPLLCCRSSDNKFSRSVTKEVGILQKTRTLSSIAVGNKRRPDGSEPISPIHVLKLPLAACIPMNIIFSRIKEVLYAQSKSVVSAVSSCL